MEKYDFLSRTGEGAYGSVWRARDKNTGLMVAVKKMKDVPTNEEESEIAMREVRVLQQAKHVNVVNLLEAYKSQSGRLYLVFEFVERTLLQELKANRSGLPPGAVKSVTWQLLQALSYLHRKQIIHRDVKPSNILLTESGVMKICDFGFARSCSNTSADPAYTTYVVTRWYRPPEVLVGDSYGPPVDIWALGCIFAEMLAGRPLFPGKNHHDQLWLILKCVGRMTVRQLELLDADPQFACFRLPTQSELEPLDTRMAGIPASAMAVLRACLDPDPQQRASADELLSMPYFQGVTEVLPMEDLAAYPDPDMKARLEQAAAQDQATAAAAAAREASLLGGSGRLALAHLGHPGKPLVLGPVCSSLPGESSPTRPYPQSLLPPHQLQVVAGPAPVPCKAATASRLDPGLDPPQRPQLQRYITAPAGSLAAKVQGPHQHLQPLLIEVYGSHLYQQPQQQSHPGSESSQHSSPRAAGSGAPERAPFGGTLGQPPSAQHLQPLRNRSSWRISGDGSSGEGPANGFSGSMRPPPPPHAVGALPAFGSGINGASSFGAMDTSSRPIAMIVTGLENGKGHGHGHGQGKGQGHASNQSTSTNGIASLAGGGHPVRAPQHRTTWNGCSAPRSNAGGATSSGSTAAVGAGSAGAHVAGIAAAPQAVASAISATAGAGSGSSVGAGAAAGPSSLAFLNYKPYLAGDTAAGQRKAQSLAGNEVLLPTSSSAASGARGPVRSISGIQGRSLAPPLGHATVSGGISSNGHAGPGLQHPPSHGLPTSAVIHRLLASPPPHAYSLHSGSQGSSSVLPGSGTGRTSHEGAGGAALATGLPSTHVAPMPMGKQLPPAPPPPQQSLHQQQPQQEQLQPQQLQVPGAATPMPPPPPPLNDVQSTVLDVEMSESCVGSDANDGRRASDTVLYAAAALREAQYRIEKATHIIAVPSNPHLSLVDQTGSGSSGVPPVFARTSAPLGLNGSGGPPSPDLHVHTHAHTHANLPPLHGTPQRRYSTSDGTSATGLGFGASSFGSGANGANGIGSGRGAPSAPQVASSSGLAQRLPVKLSSPFSSQVQAQVHAALKASPAAGSAGVHAGGGCALLPTGSVDSSEAAAVAGDGAAGAGHAFLPSLEVSYSGKGSRAASAGPGSNLLVVRRPSKGSLRVLGPDSNCKREEAANKSALLEAVPEASVL